jgi:DNA-binding CsgD family transcriptional regulator
MKDINVHNKKLHRYLGITCVLLVACLALSPRGYPSPQRGSAAFLFAIYGTLALTFLSSAIFANLGGLQAPMLFALAGIESMSGVDSIDGLGYDFAAALVLLRRGWFIRRPVATGAVIAVLGCIALLSPFVLGFASAPLSAAFAVAAYGFFVACLARGKTLAAWAPKKRVFRLEDYHLNKRELEVVRLRILGLSVKEIAATEGIALSTVRNKLSIAYRKLGLANMEDLMALGERYLVK